MHVDVIERIGSTTVPNCTVQVEADRLRIVDTETGRVVRDFAPGQWRRAMTVTSDGVVMERWQSGTPCAPIYAEGMGHGVA